VGLYPGYADVTLPSDGNVIRALLLETVMTFTLVYVVLSTTTAKNKIAPMAGLAIGFTLGLNVYSVTLIR
jgi:glycerol uptake facilitator-like aquaporin